MSASTQLGKKISDVRSGSRRGKMEVIKVGVIKVGGVTLMHF